MKSIFALKLFVDLGAIVFFMNPGVGSLAQETQPILTASAAASSRLADCTRDGEFYVCSMHDRRVKFGRTSDGMALHTFYSCHPQSVAFSPDGRFLAAAGDFNGCFSKIKVWTVKDGSLLCAFDTEIGIASLIKFSSDGSFLAVVTEGPRVDLWRWPEKKVMWFETLPKNIAQLAFSSQDGGALVVVCEDGTTRRLPLPKSTVP